MVRDHGEGSKVRHWCKGRGGKTSFSVNSFLLLYNVLQGQTYRDGKDGLQKVTRESSRGHLFLEGSWLKDDSSSTLECLRLSSPVSSVVLIMS